MIIHFNNDYLKALYEGNDLPGKPKYDAHVVKKYKKTILILKNAENVAEILRFRGLNFESLKGNYQGFYSVRINGKYRLILSVEAEEVLLARELIVEQLTNHYQ